MSEMIEIVCPVCCAHVLHEGRIIGGPATEFAKCAHGNVRDCIDLWRAWKRADTKLTVYKAVGDAVRALDGSVGGTKKPPVVWQAT
jgi:hypothetical protein